MADKKSELPIGRCGAQTATAWQEGRSGDSRVRVRRIGAGSWRASLLCLSTGCVADGSRWVGALARLFTLAALLSFRVTLTSP